MTSALGGKQVKSWGFCSILANTTMGHLKVIHRPGSRWQMECEGHDWMRCSLPLHLFWIAGFNPLWGMSLFCSLLLLHAYKIFALKFQNCTDITLLSGGRSFERITWRTFVFKCSLLAFVLGLYRQTQNSSLVTVCFKIAFSFL